MSDFTPKTRLEKILCGVATTAKTRIEKAVKYAVDHAGGGGVFETNIVLSTDTETGKQIVTTDKTAEELFEAIEAGKVVVALFTVPGPEETAISVRKTLHIGGMCAGGATYEFTFAEADADDGVIAFATADNLLPGDTVVFHKV